MRTSCLKVGAAITVRGMLEVNSFSKNGERQAPYLFVTGRPGYVQL